MNFFQFTYQINRTTFRYSAIDAIKNGCAFVITLSHQGQVTLLNSEFIFFLFSLYKTLHCATCSLALRSQHAEQITMWKHGIRTISQRLWLALVELAYHSRWHHSHSIHLGLNQSSSTHFLQAKGHEHIETCLLCGESWLRIVHVWSVCLSVAACFHGSYFHAPVSKRKQMYEEQKTQERTAVNILILWYLPCQLFFEHLQLIHHFRHMNEIPLISWTLGFEERHKAK